MHGGDKTVMRCWNLRGATVQKEASLPVLETGTQIAWQSSVSAKIIYLGFYA